MERKKRTYTDPKTGEVFEELSTRATLAIGGLAILVMVGGMSIVSAIIYLIKCLF